MINYGSKLGISSRAYGDSVSNNEGVEEIDEDSFDCSCFDFVTMPGFESARLLMKESLSTESIQTSLEKVIGKMSIPELDVVKTNV